MPKFNIRTVFQVPLWGYAEIEAETLDDALDMAEKDPDLFDLDFTEKDCTPGDPEMDEIFMEVKEDDKWISAT